MNENISSPDAMCVCPYDSTHVISYMSFPKHVLKCKKNHPMVKLEHCPFNNRHMYNKVEMRSHIARCPDRHRVEADLAYQQSGGSSAKLMGNCAVPVYEEVNIDADENWDEELDDQGRDVHEGNVGAVASLRLPKQAPKVLASTKTIPGLDTSAYGRGLGRGKPGVQQQDHCDDTIVNNNKHPNVGRGSTIEPALRQPRTTPMSYSGVGIGRGRPIPKAQSQTQRPGHQPSPPPQHASPTGRISLVSLAAGKTGSVSHSDTEATFKIPAPVTSQPPQSAGRGRGARLVNINPAFNISNPPRRNVNTHSDTELSSANQVNGAQGRAVYTDQAFTMGGSQPRAVNANKAFSIGSASPSRSVQSNDSDSDTNSMSSTSNTRSSAPRVVNTGGFSMAPGVGRGIGRGTSNSNSVTMNGVQNGGYSAYMPMGIGRGIGRGRASAPPPGISNPAPGFIIPNVNKDSPYSTPDSAGDDASERNALKEERKIRKKIKAIEALEDKHANGFSLSYDEAEKVAKKEELIAMLKKLSVS